jgi:uncharacterized protein
VPRRSDPLILDIGQVQASPGSRHSYAVAGTLPGVELPSARVPAGTEVQVEGVLEAQGSDIIADGTIRAPWVGECRRCLELAAGEVEVSFREVYSEDPVEGETFRMDDHRLDLRPMVAETLTLALPLAPLCREDCPGPAPDAHPVTPSGDETPETNENGVERQLVDERWAALDDLDLED